MSAARTVTGGRNHTTVWSALVDAATAAPEEPAVSMRAASGSWRTVDRRQFVQLVKDVSADLRCVTVGSREVVVIDLPNSPEFIASVIAAWATGLTPLVVPHGSTASERAQLLGGLGASEGGGTRSVERSPGRETREPEVAWYFPSGGSTGLPTLTPVHGAPGGILASQRLLLAQMRWRPGTQIVMGPLYHTAPFTSALAGFAGGDHLVLLERFGLAALRDAARQYPPTWFQTTPHQMDMVALHKPTFAAVSKELEGMMHTAARCPERVKRAWMDGIGSEKVFELYGSTQMVGAVFCSGDQWLEHPGTVGRPYMTQVRVVDDRGRRVPVGDVGEIYMRSGATQRLRPAQLRHVRTLPGGFCSIGDLGRVDDDGFVYLTDRVDDVMIVGGANVSAGEIESVLLRHPRIEDTIVVGRDDPLLGSAPCAVVVADGAEPSLTTEQVQSHCRASLSAHKIPVQVDFVSSIDRTAAGKIQRFKYR